MRRAFYLGVDACDAGTTLTVLEKAAHEDGAPDSADYHVHTVTHMNGESTVEDVGARILNEISDRPLTGNATVVVTRGTKEGQALLQFLASQGLTPIGVALTEGQGAAQEDVGMARTRRSQNADSGILVGRQALVQCLEDVYHSGRLHVTSEETIEEAQLLEGLFDDIAPEDAASDPDDLPLADARKAERPTIRSAGVAVYVAEQQDLNPAEELADVDPQPNAVPPPS